MPRAINRTDEQPGLDSFMDVVANLVGILIILVMVVGSQTRDALIAAGPAAQAADATAAPVRETAPPVDVESARQATAAAEQAVFELNDKVRRQDVEVAYRKRERDKWQLLVLAAEDAVAANEQSLSADDRQTLDAVQAVAAAQRELETVQGDLDAAQNAPPTRTVIEHLPTPMAQTVFGHEIHLRLAHGKLAFIPWDALIEQLKQDAPRVAPRLRDAPTATETIGPLGGFRLRYTLQRAEHSVATRLGEIVQQRVELDKFVLVPVKEDLGTSIDEAFLPGSPLAAALEQHSPGAATVTVWTYPDSFAQFREVKRRLFECGYLTAARPMPAGELIGASPRGTRSAAQ